MKASLKKTLTSLYLGRSRRATWFRYGLIAFDLVTILFFLATVAVQLTPALIVINTILGLLILMDFAARLWVADDRARMLRQVYTIADVIVVGTLLVAPLLDLHDLAVLRILRGLRLIHSYHLLRDLRRDSAFFRRHEDALLALVNLIVFIFVTTSFVFALFAEDSAGPAQYVDALYFTVSTLTTTGYGDITPTTPGGKLLSVVIMVVGVALFVQLAGAVLRPSKVTHKCPTCGLLRHDMDAVHCKHCGETLKIETPGAT
ncbi:ion channel [Sedimentitalea sp. JM2-8]|uniref:Ion channel n=1 Tax=Sedimentitalea xiamensis TaxID=3050037 RepID=A0ABT7FIB3_9RHOB|nr:potassium channel family protein [Sedimentitalea xiamensis]MDK3074735.1 ion channel [Sedimentitalea xiamensis]